MDDALSALIRSANEVVSLFVAPGMVLALGLCFFFVAIPQCRALRGYTRSRSLMGVAFLLYGAALIAEHVSAVGGGVGGPLARVIIISISASQAFLFTSTLVTLVDVEAFSVRRMAVEGMALLVVMAAVVAVAAEGGRYAWAALYVSVGGYVVLLAYYVVVFRRCYAVYRRRMDDYYSSDEYRWLLWVERSFYWSLGIGLLALLYSFVLSAATSLLFMSVAVAYYAFFGIRFINYAFTFKQYEDAIACGGAAPSGIPVPPQAPQQSPTADDEQLMAAIERLMHDERLYRRQGLTVAVVAARLGRNHRVVSEVISRCGGTNFKTYVNAFRVEEAVALMASGWLHDHTVDALAEECGFASRVSFYRVFKRMKGVAPTDYMVT